MKSIVLTMVVMAMAVALAEKQPIERYQSIVERQMFGALPPNFDPTKLPSEVTGGKSVDKQLTKEQETLKSAVHFSVIDVKPNGTVKIGFTDNSDAQKPRSYLLAVGEESRGWKVVCADPEAATTTLEKDGVQLELSLGDDSSKGGGNASKANANEGGKSSLLNGGFRSRRQRREDETKAVLEAAKRAQEAQEEERVRREQENEDRKKQQEEMRDALEALQKQVKANSEKAAAAKKDEDKPADDSANENNDAQ